MREPQFQLKSYAIGFVVPTGPASDRTWGRYVRGNVTRYRNYRRPIRGGVSFHDVVQFRLMQARTETQAALAMQLLQRAFK